MDFTDLNEKFAWNISVLEVDGWLQVKRHQFGAALSDEYFNFVDAQDEEIAVYRDFTIYDMNVHTPIIAEHHESMEFIACMLEGDWIDGTILSMSIGMEKS